MPSWFRIGGRKQVRVLKLADGSGEGLVCCLCNSCVIQGTS